MSTERRPNNAGCLGLIATAGVIAILGYGWLETQTANNNTDCSVRNGTESSFSAGGRVFNSDQVNAALGHYCQWEQKEAGEYKVPLELGLAIKLAETDVWYNHKADTAISGCGAVGVNQIMPRDIPTGICGIQNTGLFADRPTTAELVNPQTNIHWKYFLLQNYYRSLGNWDAAVRKYGPIDDGSYLKTVQAIRTHLK